MKHVKWGLVLLFILLVVASVVKGPCLPMMASGQPEANAGYAYLNPADVILITRVGGLPSNRIWSILYSENDRAQIDMIVGMVNRSIDIGPATPQEQASHAFGYPGDIAIRTKDRVCYLERIMDTTLHQTATGWETTGKINEDHFMLEIEQGGHEKHDTLCSTEVPDYIMRGADADIPRRITLASPFTRLFVQELVFKTDIPAMLPQYWPALTPGPAGQEMHYGIVYKSAPDGYNINIASVSKQFWPNSPELSRPPYASEANQLGSISGYRTDPPVSGFVVTRPPDSEPFEIDAYRGWKTPVAFYWATGAWQCEVIGASESLMPSARELADSLHESVELKLLYARNGKILVECSNGLITLISWQSADGRYTYSITYRGSIRDAIKIADSCLVI